MLVTHDMGSVRNMCDRAIWLTHGKMTGEGDPADLVEQVHRDDARRPGRRARPARGAARARSRSPTSSCSSATATLPVATLPHRRRRAHPDALPGDDAGPQARVRPRHRDDSARRPSPARTCATPASCPSTSTATGVVEVLAARRPAAAGHLRPAHQHHRLQPPARLRQPAPRGAVRRDDRLTWRPAARDAATRLEHRLNMDASGRSPFISYAQNGEDIVLHRALGHITGGCYVDVGSADPVDDSVSFAFYERGWRGVHVEPVPALASALRRVRPDDRVFEVAAGRSRGRSELFVAAGTGRSTLFEEIAIATGADGPRGAADRGRGPAARRDPCGGRAGRARHPLPEDRRRGGRGRCPRRAAI